MTTPALLADTVRESFTRVVRGSDGHPVIAVGGDTEGAEAALAALVKLAERNPGYLGAVAERDAAVARADELLKELESDPCAYLRNKEFKQRKRAEAAEARAAKLEAALERFGRHGTFCAWLEGRGDCDCGLAALLVSAGRDEQETT